MKQFIAVLLVLSMVLGLAACGAQTNVPETTAGTAPISATEGESATEPTEAAEAVEETVEATKGADEKESTEPTGANNQTTGGNNSTATTEPSGNQNNASEPNGNTTNAAPTGEYNPGVVLVKVKNSFNAADLGELKYTAAEPLYKGAKWYSVQLEDKEKTEEAVAYLLGLGTFAGVDYDYVMATDAKEEENPNYNDQTNLGLSNIPYGWTQNGKAPGGSPDVIIAVIDTGVDYNHKDLRNNIWINSAEIPDNGKDDDGNGYIDDVYGWDCVGNDNNPMDDNGHGTHVAGIIAAENNKDGGVGVAYNCKVMVLKAGNSSGYFNNSDIAEAIQYAYMNGASVINMSFGGSSISIAVEDALESAYNSCVLVAAAGNDGACNDLKCKKCDVVKITYPAALPYVIGVMSTDKDGKNVSSFSNYDHSPYDSVEYEVFAVGEGVGSTWPSNKYACLNGTSMAAPTVSGIAALLRSSFSDREVYSTKFIQSQIVNTGTVNPYNLLLEKTDAAHSVADVQEALTKLPKPAVNLYDYYIDDSTSINKNNNGNGVIDAGETVRLHISLHNRGGVASNVNVSIDTYRSEVGNEAMTDPYFTFVNPTMELSDIGTYSVRESGDKYFEIVVSPDCPNDYLVNFNIRFTYKNGMDEKDKTEYNGDGEAQFNVSSGYHLPSIITEDAVFTNDRLYIVGENVMIPAGVTVTFEEGCRIQFYDDSEYYNSPRIVVYGTLNMDGTKDEMITINPSERYTTFACIVENHATVNVNYVKSTNLYMINAVSTGKFVVSNSYLRQDATWGACCYKAGKIDYSYSLNNQSEKDEYYGNYIELYSYADDIRAAIMDGNYIAMAANQNIGLAVYSSFKNNIVYTYEHGSYGYTGYVQTFKGEVTNNTFLSVNDENPKTLLSLNYTKAVLDNNTFSAGYQQYANQVITNYLDANGQPTVDVFGQCSDISALYPHVVSVEMFNADGEKITTIGKEEITVRVTFNRPMAQDVNPTVTFGTIAPYADYKIEGQWVDELVWEGTYELKAQIENGQNFLKVTKACAADDPTKVVKGEYQLHEFTIDTTAAMAMTLFATATDSGIELTWAQDDYDTLMGYNIYRSTAKDGNYVKINPSVLTAGESSFVDTNAEPGKTYWYTFTVVLSDFTESAPAGKVFCTAVDTINPTVYHTPVNQGYLNNNLVISCTASDNMQVASVTLYYRAAGAEQWKSLAMQRVNDKYSATVFGSDLTLAGLEYYIVAADTSNSVSKGTAEDPYFVVIKDSSVISRKGDVDGNGVVDTKDALMIIQCINGELIMTDDEFKRADLNGDNLLSSVEALRILQYINGNVPDLNM